MLHPFPCLSSLWPVCLIILQTSCTVTVAEEKINLPDSIQATLQARCLDCHSGDTAEAEIRLDEIHRLELPRQLEILNRAEEQLFLKRMPPEESDPLTVDQQSSLSNWLSTELNRFDASTLKQKLRKPEYANYLDHEQLFSGQHAALPGFTHDRRWLISEYIFNARFQRILQVNSRARRHGRNVVVLGAHKINQLSLTNPFLLPERSGVRYYANTDLSGGHLSSMLTNAQNVSVYMTDYLAKRNPKYLPAFTAIMALEDQHNQLLASRRQFLTDFIDRLCREYYGPEHRELLPVFIPVQLKEVEELAEGETYKKAPFHVAQNMLKSLEGENTVYQTLMAPEHQSRTDAEFRELCERTWFYFGDHERRIQGRMTILRDYLPELRENLEKNRRKFKPLVYKALSDEEMQIIETAIRRHRKQGDVYSELIDRCMQQWEQEFLEARAAAGPPSAELIGDLTDELFALILERPPQEEERSEYVGLTENYISKLGNLKASQKLIQTLILSSEFVWRQEFGHGEADQHGRRLLSPRDAAYAIAYALTDQSPDAELLHAAGSGKLNTPADYQREVTRILNRRDLIYLIDPILADRNYQENTTDLPIRKLRFFREFFGYPKAISIFKDEKRFGGDRFGNAMSRLLNETDRLVEHILHADERVFERLLSTDEFFVYHDGDNERMQAASDRIKSIYAHFRDTDWQNFRKEDLLDHRDFLKEVKMRSVDPDKLEARNRQGNTIQLFKKSMTTITARLDKGQREAAPYDLYRGYGNDFMPGYNVAKFFNYSLDNWDYATQQPAKVPNRRGMLTHPAWLIAHSQNTETDPVIRGKWILEKLLAGTVPDIPITVDAAIPEDHGRTLRDRLASATENTYCWKCHQLMNPLGYVFESYDDFGRYRQQESLEYPDQMLSEGPEQKGNHLIDTRDTYRTLPVDSSGTLAGTGNPSLDGPVTDAIDLATRLSESARVRQSIIRHAFRYFLGRNETLSDSKTLIDADQAYLNSNGSFDAVIVSLLTSDSFVYRKPVQD